MAEREPGSALSKQRDIAVNKGLGMAGGEPCWAEDSTDENEV